MGEVGTFFVAWHGKAHSREGKQGAENEDRDKYRRGDQAYRFEAHERDAISGYYANSSRGCRQALPNGAEICPPDLRNALSPYPSNSSASCRRCPWAAAAVELS